MSLPPVHACTAGPARHRRARCWPGGSGCWSPPPSPTTSSRRSSRSPPGTIASSTALIGFGLDSVIEVSSAAAVAWQFAGRDPEARERAALRIIALSFFALAAYVTVESVRALLGGQRGRALHRRHRAGRACRWRSCRCCRTPSAAPAASSAPARRSPTPSRPCCAPTCPRSCWSGWLLNSLFGWSWADPIAALVIAAVAVKEGRDAWRGHRCCYHPQAGRGAYMMTATPTRQITAPMMSQRSGRKPSSATPHSSEPATKTPP